VKKSIFESIVRKKTKIEKRKTEKKDSTKKRVGIKKSMEKSFKPGSNL